MPLQPGIGGDVGLDAGEGAQVVDPQAHLPAASMRQAPRQPPANADVAVIVDHAAEDVGPQDAARYQWNWAGAVSASSGSSARSEEHTSELQSLMRISYAVFCLKKKNKKTT